MNPTSNGIDAGSFTASLMAISTPMESLDRQGKNLQLNELKEVVSNEGGFAGLLGALGDLLPAETLERFEAMMGDGNGLPQSVAELTYPAGTEELLFPSAALLSIARQVEQATGKPLAAQSQLLPSPLQTQLSMGVANVANAQTSSPTGPEIPIAAPGVAAAGDNSQPLVAVQDMLKSVAGGAKGSESELLKLASGVQAGDLQSGNPAATATLLKTIESSSAMRPMSVVPTPLETPLTARGWEQGIGERVLWMVGKSIKSASLRINPAHLGPIEIKVSMQQEQASVTFSAQHAPVREALEMSIPRLREMFTENNIQLANVDVGQRGQGQQQGSGLAQDSESNRFGHAENGSSAALGPDELEAESVTQIASEGLLDDYA